MNQEQTIVMLSSLVRMKLAPSPIHGIGVFAIRNIPKGTILNATMFPKAYKVAYSNFDKLLPEVRDLLLERWPQIVNGSAFMYPDTFLQGYMNHADDPNYDAKNDITLKDIKEGEEVTEDYRKIEGYQEVFPWLT